MSLYDEMQLLARDILGDPDFNQPPITYVHVSPGAGPTHNPGASTRAEYLLDGAVARGVEYKYLQSGFAIASDKQVIAAVDSRFTPDRNGRMIIDNTEYKIKNWAANPAAGTPVVWIFICEK